MNPSKPEVEAWQALLPRVPICLLLVDATGNISHANDCAAALFGWPPEELAGSSVDVLVPGPFRRAHVEHRERFQRDGRVRRMGSASRLEARHRDGHLFPVDVMLAPAGDGKVLTVVIDRSDLRQAEAHSERIEASLRHLIERVPDIVYVVQSDGNPLTSRVELLSDHVERVLGYSAKELREDRMLWFASIHPDDHVSVARSTEEMFDTGKPVVRTYRMRHKLSGAFRLMEDRVAPVFDARGSVTGYCGSARDVSEQRLSHAEMAVAERMATLGVLAAGVSHELANPLTGVLANVAHVLDRLRAEPPSDGRVVAELEDALEGLTRMRAILADHIGLARPGEGVALVDVRRCVDLAARLAAPTVTERADLERTYADVAPVRADETRLAQVFLNLLLNAAQAIPDERRGSIEVRVVCEGERTVCVDVLDDGEGIPPEALPRVFDAFFTTKPPGVGTGLGLHVCRSLVREMGGDIRIESERGQGTRVRVVLPVALV